MTNRYSIIVPPFSRLGFTILELLVVISVVAILASLLLPTIAQAKHQGRKAVCLSNKRQISIAWASYADDNADKLVYNSPGVYSSLIGWTVDWMSWTVDERTTNIDRFKEGRLARYATLSHKVFKCPEDTFLSPAQRSAGLAERPRSVSMNYFVGFANEPEGDFFASKERIRGTVLFVRMSDFNRTNPSQIYVFLDEHPDSITGGCMLPPVSKSDTAWPRLPASYHLKGSILSFADGHAEYKRWVSRTTIEPVLYSHWADRATKGLSSDRRDFDWLRKRSTEWNHDSW
ncbi:MAG: type II secretion system protein [Verrucomicrobiota bacterium]